MSTWIEFQLYKYKKSTKALTKCYIQCNVNVNKMVFGRYNLVVTFWNSNKGQAVYEAGYNCIVELLLFIIIKYVRRVDRIGNWLSYSYEYQLF